MVSETSKLTRIGILCLERWELRTVSNPDAFNRQITDDIQISI